MQDRTNPLRAALALALFAPEVYLRLQVYPGAEAHITTLIMAGIGYMKKENVLGQ